MLNCSPQSSLPVPWPFWELRGCTAGDITLFKERAGVARSAQIIPAVKQNLIKIESFFFSLRLCHGVFLQSENYKLRTKRTHCCGKQCRRIYICLFCVAKRLLGNAPSPFDLHFPMQAAHPFGTLFIRWCAPGRWGLVWGEKRLLPEKHTSSVPGQAHPETKCPIPAYRKS